MGSIESGGAFLVEKCVCAQLLATALFGSCPLLLKTFGTTDPPSLPGPVSAGSLPRALLCPGTGAETDAADCSVPPVLRTASRAQTAGPGAQCHPELGPPRSPSALENLQVPFKYLQTSIQSHPLCLFSWAKYQQILHVFLNRRSVLRSPPTPTSHLKVLVSNSEDTTCHPFPRAPRAPDCGPRGHPLLTPGHCPSSQQSPLPTLGNSVTSLHPACLCLRV